MPAPMRTPTRRKRVGQLLNAAVLAGTAAFAVSACAASAPAPRPAETAAAPVLAPLARLDGGQLEPSSLAGRIVVLDFMSAWCEPCIEGLPHQVALAERYAGSNVTFLIVAQDPDPQPLAEILREHAVALPVVLDGEQQWFDTFGLRFVPSVVVLDARGAVALRLGSGDTPELTQVAATLDRLLTATP